MRWNLQIDLTRNEPSVLVMKRAASSFVIKLLTVSFTAAWTFRNQFAGISIPLIRSVVAGCGRVRSRSEMTRLLVFFTAVLEGDD